jgi:predicted ATP-grasp superfamily ATP-dependent carboligase
MVIAVKVVTNVSEELSASFFTVMYIEYEDNRLLCQS